MAFVRIRRVAVALILAVGPLTIAILARREDVWPCTDFLYANGDPVSGFQTEDQALEAGVIQLAIMGFTRSEVADARDAMRSEVGADRYTDGEGLFLEDVPVAQFAAIRLPDGTFVVSVWKTCAPSASNGATPSMEEGS